MYRKMVACGFVSVLLSSTAFAGPLEDVGDAVTGAAEYVGDTVVDTGKAVGKTVGDTADAVTGDVNYAEVRRELDKTAEASLKRLFAAQPSAKELYNQSYGYAVFDNRKTAFLLAGGTGSGVAIDKKSKKRIYMRMGTVGANIGAGIQFYQSVFLFETKGAFESFINSGWEANASGNAALGKEGLGAEAKFNGGMVFYQLNDSGVMLNASLAGTKYWKSDELNNHKG